MVYTIPRNTFKSYWEDIKNMVNGHSQCYPTSRSIQGSPVTPYIWDDRCKPEDAADRIREVYDLGPEKRKELGA